MSFYRQSPGKRPTFSRSPPRLLATERELIQQEIHLKNAYRSDAESRRLLDEISLLQIKLRKTEELESKVETLLKQNSLLSQQNEHLSRELAERRYDLDRVRSNSVQLQERDNIKSAQLSEINRGLEMEIDLLKKERLESNKLYEAHIQKLEFMLEDKIKELDMLSFKCNELLNEKETTAIKFEDERNKLKNLVARTSHDLERELEYTKERQSTEKHVQIETLKKNYTSQLLLLQDEIGKLKGANSYKNNEFEGLLQENKLIRQRYDKEVRSLEGENGILRDKIIKLEELNRSEVHHIEQKYSDIQKKGANNLMSEHGQEIKMLAGEIDKMEWLLKDKNEEIQNLIRDKKEAKAYEAERELTLQAQIGTLKNKLETQREKSATEAQDQTKRIHVLSDKLLKESEGHSQRIKDFRGIINGLESEVKLKQGCLDAAKTAADLNTKELSRVIQQLEDSQERLQRDLADLQAQKVKLSEDFSAFKQNSERKVVEMSKKITTLEIENSTLVEKTKREGDSAGKNEQILRLEIDSLKKIVAKLEQSFSSEQRSHNKELEELAERTRVKVEQLQETQKKRFQELDSTHSNEMEAMNRRMEKYMRDKEEMEQRLREYITMYEKLEKYLKSPSEGAIWEEKSRSNVYEVLSQVAQSSIHIF